jgi:hypothetical protein
MPTEEVLSATRDNKEIRRGNIMNYTAMVGHKHTISYTEIIAWKQPHWKKGVKAFLKLLQRTLYESHLFIRTNVIYL